MRSTPLAFGVFAAALLTGCGQTSAPDAGSLQTAKTFVALKADEVHWNADWKSGDAAKIASHFGDKAKLMVPDAPVAEGVPAIEALIQKALDAPGFGYSFSSDKITVAKSGDVAVARGTYTETAANAASGSTDTQVGTYLTVYRTQPDGSWKAQWYIQTPGPVAAKPAAP